MEKCKLGVIGLGHRISAGVLPPLFELSDDIVITAVADIDDKIREKMAEKPEFYAEDARVYTDADEMLEKEELDGIFIGTRCNLHTEMAIKAMKKGVPIFLEKPVCTNPEELQRLNEAAKLYQPKVLVSFPLRFTPITMAVKEMLDSGVIGDVIQVDAYNDVPYGRVYYHNWYRDESLTGGLWLQKATHDFDYLSYILGDRATEIFAMEHSGLFRGDMPAGLKCEDCAKNKTCPESPYVIKNKYHDAVIGKWCCFAEDTGNHDCATATIRYSKGTIVTYNQNFFARHKAARRGARFYGYKGTLEFDWYTAEIKVYNHDKPRVDTYSYHGDGAMHFGGDEPLSEMYLDMLFGKSDASYIYEGLQSANMCLAAKKSCESGMKIVVPEL